MMKTYETIVRFEGTIIYEVEASNAAEAKEKAANMFGDESDMNIVSEISDVEVCYWTEI